MDREYTDGVRAELPVRAGGARPTEASKKDEKLKRRQERASLKRDSGSTDATEERDLPET